MYPKPSVMPQVGFEKTRPNKQRSVLIWQERVPPLMVQFKNLRSNLRMSTVAHLSSLYELMAIVTSIRWRPLSALSYNYERHTNEGWPEETSQ